MVGLAELPERRPLDPKIVARLADGHQPVWVVCCHGPSSKAGMYIRSYTPYMYVRSYATMTKGFLL